MCLYPNLIYNRKYMANKKNGGEIPHCHDERVKTVAVGCGNCIECRKQKANNWKVRLTEEVRERKNAMFITMTFSDEKLQEVDNKISEELKGYDRDNAIASYAIRHWTENWRKKHKKTIRHWMVTELGGNETERLHIHGVVWTDEKFEEIEKRWIYGKVILGDGKGKHYVNDETIGYIVKYISKIDKKHPNYKSKVYASNGIGRGYIDRNDAERNKYIKDKTKETYKTRTGTEMGLPVYYRNKIYSEEEREKLWIEKLDKNERWVLGQKIDISKSDKDYYRTLYEARVKNKRLGYGDDEINWELRRYERQRRNMKKMERMERLRKKEMED